MSNVRILQIKQNKYFAYYLFFVISFLLSLIFFGGLYNQNNQQTVINQSSELLQNTEKNDSNIADPVSLGTATALESLETFKYSPNGSMALTLVKNEQNANLKGIQLIDLHKNIISHLQIYNVVEANFISDSIIFYRKSDQAEGLYLYDITSNEHTLVFEFNTL